MRIPRVSVSFLCVLIASSARPALGQEEVPNQGWTLAGEASVGLYVPARNLGVILSSESVHLEVNRSTTVLMQGGFLSRTPSPGISVRGMVGYAPYTATGRPTVCEVVVGAACVGVEAEGSVLSGVGEILLHPSDRNVHSYPYFVAGLGVRHYSFTTNSCDPSDPQYLVCLGLNEFLSDQTRILAVVGIGYVRNWGPLRLRFEVSDFIGGFEGAGERGEGGTQNDVSFSAGISFPRR